MERRARRKARTSRKTGARRTRIAKTILNRFYPLQSMGALNRDLARIAGARGSILFRGVPSTLRRAVRKRSGKV